MPGSHALLSASSAHRWLSCAPSARLEQRFEDKETEAAREGTAAHALAEYKLKQALHLKSLMPTSKYDCNEMSEHTESYVQFVLELVAKAKETCADPLVLIEQRLDFSAYVPEGFGTGDCVIVANDKLYVVELKYGTGVLVEAKDNPQMKLYALGALSLFDSLYDIKEISMTIFQPRRENISTWTIKVTDLLEWANATLKEKAQLAYKGEGSFEPGPWCIFCRASPICRARAQEQLKLAQKEFKLPPLLTDEEIEEILGLLPDLTKWANEISDYALDAALSHGKEWKGYKVVEGRSNRKYRDEEAVAKKAQEAGFTDIYRQELLPITELQKLMGKKTFEEVLGSLVYKPIGKPTLVPDSDKRPPMNVNDVKNEFSEI